MVMGQRCSHLTGLVRRPLFRVMSCSEVRAGVRVGAHSCSSDILLPQQGEDRHEPAMCGSGSCKPPALGKYCQEPPSPGAVAPKSEGGTQQLWCILYLHCRKTIICSRLQLRHTEGQILPLVSSKQVAPRCVAWAGDSSCGDHHCQILLCHHMQPCPQNICFDGWQHGDLCLRVFSLRSVEEVSAFDI